MEKAFPGFCYAIDGGTLYLRFPASISYCETCNSPKAENCNCNCNSSPATERKKAPEISA